MIDSQDISTNIITYSDSISEDQSQRVKYDNPLFQCVAKQSLYSSGIPYSIPEHWHEDLEYLVVLDGKLHYTVEGESFILNKGEGVLVNSKRIHANSSPQDEYCLFCYVIIHPSYVCASPYIEQKYVEPLLGRGTFDYVLLKEGTWTAPILDEILRMFQKDPGEELELEIIETSYRVTRMLYRHYKPLMKEKPVSGFYDTAFKNMLSYIRDHYSEKVSLDDLAEAGAVGKTLCSKLFVKFTAKTPGDYLIHYRIMKGIDLLKSTDMGITEIASAVGFASNSHFTKASRQTTGTTPLKYRKAAQRTI